MNRPTLLAMAATAAVAAVSSPSAPALADDTRQASEHFQRGVALYGEADYRAALVEFRRAYALAPNPAVLYNVGETQYQLQDYANALTSFENFLAEAPPGDGHRAEVEGDLEVLRARVGHVAVETVPTGADVTIDDQPAGRTPLERPLLVSVGHRKLAASTPGGPTIARYVDVAADDNLSITIELPEAGARPSPSVVLPEANPSPLDPPRPTSDGNLLPVLGWATTVVLAAGAGCLGYLALTESHDLETERGTYPASAQTLNRDASLTTTYSALADGLAAAALIAGGVTLLATVVWRPSHGPARASAPPTSVVVGPVAARLIVNF